MSTRKHRWLDHPKAVQDYHARYVAGVGVDAGGSASVQILADFLGFLVPGAIGWPGLGSTKLSGVASSMVQTRPSNPCGHRLAGMGSTPGHGCWIDMNARFGRVK